MGRIARPILGVVAMLVVAIAAVAAILRRRTSARVRDIPFSSCRAGRAVGADWADRCGYAGESVVGEIEDFAVFDRDDFDADAVDPEIRRFYERTAAYDLAYAVRWHGGFRPGAWLASFATSRVRQLNLPGRSDDGIYHLESRLARVPEVVDPRDSVVWTRTDPETGEAVFVAVYATHEYDGVTYANVAVPLPGSNLSTVLRPERIAVGDGGRDGVAFTTEGPGDGGLYLVTPLGPLDVPMDQSFRVWPVDADGAPEPPIADADLVATHEMWLLGRQFLTLTYGIRRSAGEAGS